MQRRKEAGLSGGVLLVFLLLFLVAIAGPGIVQRAAEHPLAKQFTRDVTAKLTKTVDETLHSVKLKESSWEIRRADDFSDPPTGLFLRNQQGVSSGTFSDGRQYAVPWEYTYEDGLLVVRIKGPYPEHPDRLLIGPSASSADKVLEDFAIEVHATAIKSSNQVSIGISYYPAFGEYYLFRVEPGTKAHSVYMSRERRNLSYGRMTTISLNEDNHLRLEVIGDTMRTFVNGRLPISPSTPAWRAVLETSGCESP